MISFIDLHAGLMGGKKHPGFIQDALAPWHTEASQVSIFRVKLFTIPRSLFRVKLFTIPRQAIRYSAFTIPRQSLTGEDKR